MLLCQLSAMAKGPKVIARNTFRFTTAGIMVTLDGSGSYDPDGTIVSYLWEQVGVSPNIAYINTPSSAKTTVAPAVWVLGIYMFRLTVTDNGGLSASDTMKVTVINSINKPPLISAGSNQSFTLYMPSNSISLTGSAIDVDGRVVSLVWKITGPNSPGIQGQGTINVKFTNLVAGIYIVTLTGKDNGNLSTSSQITITVFKHSCSWWEKLFGRCK